MILHTASFYEPGNWRGTAVRVSRQHPRGMKTAWDVLPAAYPTAELARAYKMRQITSEEYASHYLSLLEERYAQDESFRRWMATGLSGEGEMTFLCFERAGEFCHRRLLAQWLVEKAGGASLGILL